MLTNNSFPVANRVRPELSVMADGAKSSAADNCTASERSKLNNASSTTDRQPPQPALNNDDDRRLATTIGEEPTFFDHQKLSSVVMGTQASKAHMPGNGWLQSSQGFSDQSIAADRKPP